ncbi:sulfurtransferase [Ornithinimicrobium pekingense]|uniref:Sulfurtransferase n=1 Tax=Ornithinimicrobium pekingense TaxID=384677 RepID=A0ABQ2F548_9MICO|nr:sulfurtransferase [Ornithinimicrobium pekingense]GGK61486.1 sulfurtransferase [Ornithinimicrobium pekingense]
MPRSHHPLVSAGDLAAELSADGPATPRPVLVDVRWSLGTAPEDNRAAYLAGHLPGASFLDLDGGLSDPVAPDRRGGRHPMPSLERVQAALRAAGVCRDRPVVFYDARISAGAARAWWVASYYGVAGARVLDGGLSAWQDAGLPVETGSVDVPEGDVVLTAGRRPLLDADGLAAWLEGGGQVLDARPANRFRGEDETIDPVAGHVPGARSFPSLALLAEDGTFLPADAIEALLTDAGADPATPTALYCGSGVTAAHAALALEAAGLLEQTPALYVGSWSDWVSDPTRPVATGPAQRPRRPASPSGYAGRT